MKAKSWKQIEASRERRLWLTQVIIPGSAIASTILLNPQYRASLQYYADAAKYKAQDAIYKAKNKFKK